MQVINAFWEKRNLGIETTEIVLSNSDSLSDIENTLNLLSSEKQYIVVKIPNQKIDFVKLLTDKGFCFMESLFEISLHIKDYILPEYLKRFDEMLIYKKMMTDGDFALLETEIKKGIFISDRISLDPNFGINIAAVRYINWIKDELEKGSEIFEILLKEEPIGFFSLKKLSSGKYDNFLAGMYRNKKNTGFGFSILSKSISELIIRQAEIYVTHISSNNLPIMRLYFSLGFCPSDVVYVMTKLG